jgi:DNA-binding transcriptional LysR family regulator
MRGPGLPSIDQLAVFLSVVETGSFAAAGRKLGRATSAISYTIANLELQLGLPLFDRDRTRRPALTKAGAAVLSEARTVQVGVDNLRAKVKGLLEGLEPEVALVVDVMLPTSRLVDAMQAFGAAFPTVALRLHVEALGAVTQLVNSGVAHIGIREPRHGNVPGLEADRGRRCGTGSGRGTEPPVGALFCEPARSRAKPYAAGSHRPFVARRGAGFWSDRRQVVASGGPRHQACAAAGGGRLGQYARADGSR